MAILIKKKLGKAIYRNYEKRVIREIFRCNKDLLNGYDLIIFVKQKVKNISFNEKKYEIESLFKNIAKHYK